MQTHLLSPGPRSPNLAWPPLHQRPKGSGRRFPPPPHRRRRASSLPLTLTRSSCLTKCSRLPPRPNSAKLRLLPEAPARSDFELGAMFLRWLLPRPSYSPPAAPGPAPPSRFLLIGEASHVKERLLALVQDGRPPSRSSLEGAAVHKQTGEQSNARVCGCARRASARVLIGGVAFHSVVKSGRKGGARGPASHGRKTVD